MHSENPIPLPWEHRIGRSSLPGPVRFSRNQENRLAPMINGKAPQVSVCIPVLNGSDYISYAIESVLAQTFRDFELIVCDNCSTDNTPEIVAGFRDSRIKYVRNQKDLGLVGNHNRCIDLASGEFIYILHYDDCMMPDNLERKVRLLNERSDVGFVHSNIVTIDFKGEVVSPNIWSEDSRYDYFEDGMTVFHRYLSYLPIGASIFIGAVLARRECYALVGKFSEELPHCMDSEMWMRMALFYNVACIGTPLVMYRVHHGSTTSNWGDYTSLLYLKEHFLAAQMVFEKHNDRIPKEDMLKRKFSLAFGERAMTLACDALNREDYALGKSFIKESLKMYNALYFHVIFWKAVTLLVAGPSGIEFFRFLKKHIISSIKYCKRAIA